jgi:hypothetical protein
MRRILAGVAVGLLIGTLGFYFLRATWHDYAVAEPDMNFFFSMQLARLAVGAACPICGGWIAALVADGNSKAAWILGVVLLLMFIPIHYGIWDRLPIWYHLVFLLTLAPITGFSACIRLRRSWRS